MPRRIAATLAALPLLVAGGLGTAAAYGPPRLEVAAHSALAAARAHAPEAAAERAEALLAGPLGPCALLAGLLLLALAAGRGARPAAPDGGAEGAGGPEPDRRLARKLERQASTLARKGRVGEAAELCLASGLLDPAADYLEQAGELDRAAGIHHDRNRFDRAAELHRRAGSLDTAGAIHAAQGEPARAAECYLEAGHLVQAGEMFEKAGRLARAGACFADAGFHRHAAQAFVRAQDWARAAQSLEQVIAEEGARGAEHGRTRGLQKLVLKAGKLWEHAGDLEAALRVLEKGGCAGPAAEVALRLERFDRAAEHFQRAGDAPRAADALRRLGEDRAAAQLLGEHHRDRGELAEAARWLEEAGDGLSAGDLYRQLEDPLRAAACYEAQGEAAQAAEMYRAAGAPERAAPCFERSGQLDEAAECWREAGEAEREADALARAGRLRAAGEAYHRQGLDDRAIQVLQQVKPDDAECGAAAALLGEIFRARGRHGLAVKTLRQAIGESEIAAGNLEAVYALARVHEDAGELAEAAEVFERILAFDYHHRDVEARLASLRARLSLSGAPTQEAGAGAGIPAPSGRSGRYRISGELGRGGMGIVYKAEDTVLDRPVAFKVLPRTLEDNPQALRSFLREAKSAAKLNHPNIVTVYDAGEQDGRYYIAMEYVDGTTLKEILRRRGVISPTGVLHVLLQLCDALEYAHRQRVIHRDVKTANAMWTRDRKAKIMDFGLAKVVEEVRGHTTLVSGTPYYMSPEQTLGRSVDPRTDLYSLGVTLFELATGRLPFREGNVPYHHVHTEAPDPRSLVPDLPPLLAEAIVRCLRKDPEERFPSAGELARQVREALGRSARSAARA